MDDNDIIKGLENWIMKDLIVIWCNDKDNNLMPVTVKDILKVINNLKVETVKEFAERIKKNSCVAGIDRDGRTIPESVNYTIREIDLAKIASEIKEGLK